jgi:hypothetical protein
MWNADEWLWFLGNRQKYQRPDGTWGWEPINKDPNFAFNWFSSNLVEPPMIAVGLGAVPLAVGALRGGNPAPARPNTGQNPQSGLPPARAPDGTNTPPARFVVDRKGVITDTLAPSSAPLSQGQQSAIRKIDNTISGHLKPGPKGDISGTVSDMVGNPIPKPSGGYWDHVQEMQNTLRGLRNQAATLERVTDPVAQAARQRALDAIAEIEAAIKGAGL